MFDQHMICEDTMANVAENGAAIGFSFGARLPYYRGLGLSMGAANLLGGYLGARTAIARGNTFVRKVFLLVVAALALKLAYDIIRGALS